MAEKRPKSEEEWFARHERTLIANLKRERERREKAVAALMRQDEARKQKELHWMKCPKCGSGLKESPQLQGIMVDQCELCGGLYFDRDELEQDLLKKEEQRKSFRNALLRFLTPTRRGESESDQEKSLSELHAIGEKKKKAVEESLSHEDARKRKALHWMKCPKCGSDMSEHEIHEKVMVDQCRVCFGVFLDFGELEILGRINDKARGSVRRRLIELGLPEENKSAGQ